MIQNNLAIPDQVKIDYAYGEKIIIENNWMRVPRSPHKIRVPVRIDNDFAYLAGYHLGDGYLENYNHRYNRVGKGNFEITYADEDKAQIENINKIFLDKFNTTFIHDY